MAIIYTDEELIRILKRYAKKLGRTPTTVDIIALGGPSRNAFYRHFGRSWDGVIEAAGLPSIERKSLHKKYMYTDTPSREELIDALKSFVDEHGYMPIISDYPDFYRIARKLFKSYAELVEASGFDYEEIMANTENERTRRRGAPLESDICKAVRKSTPCSGFSCEFIKKYMQGDFE